MSKFSNTKITNIYLSSYRDKRAHILILQAMFVNEITICLFSKYAYFRYVFIFEVIQYSAWNHSKIAKLNETFAQKGYSLSNPKDSKDPECEGFQGLPENFCGEFSIYSKHWRIQ